MPLRLHNPASQAHIDELEDRLRTQLASAPHVFGPDDGEDALVEMLVDVVRAMDRGTLTAEDAMEAFTRHRIPGFSFVKWLVDMVDEGVYLETTFSKAA